LLEQERGQRIEVERGSKLDWTPVRESVRQNGMRNSNCMAIAPTATIANIAGCFPGGEPIYKNVYVKSNMGGEFVITNSYLIDELKALNLWSDSLLMEIKRKDGNISEIDMIPKVLRDKYKETFDIEPEWIIKAAAYRGKWIDQSQSTNIFLKTTSGKRIGDAYMYAWKMGLKTTYYLRTLAATSVEKSTVDLQQPVTVGGMPQESKDSDAVASQPVDMQPNQPPKVKSLLEGLVSAAKKADIKGFGMSNEPMAGQAVMAMAGGGTAIAEQQPVAMSEMKTGPGAMVVTKSEIVGSGKVAEISDAGLKLCAIDDPECEACQ